MKKLKSRKRLLSMMEKGIYTLPKDFTFNREELYDCLFFSFFSGLFK